ncbi:predicted protein [Postia placenta Mad-698-R]|nr:predicted protein [Postia placenta Mad-698-R]
MPFSPCDEIALRTKFSPVAALPCLMLQAVLLTAVFLYSIWRALSKHIPSANAPPLVDLTILNLHYFLAIFPSWGADLEDTVQNGINARLENVVEQIFPIFVKRTEDIMHRHQGQPIDMFEHAHASIAEAMTVLILGEGYVNEINIALVTAVAAEIAILTGIYQNTSIFARFRVMMYSVSYRFLGHLGPVVWRELRGKTWRPDPTIQKEDDWDNGNVTLLAYFACKHADPDTGEVTVLSVVKVIVILLGIVFASVHQSASVVVWVVFKLATSPEYLDSIRQEMKEYVNPETGNISLSCIYRVLKGANHLNAFIREVMRTKGDTLMPYRSTTHNMLLANYAIPHGQLVTAFFGNVVQ